MVFHPHDQQDVILNSIADGVFTVDENWQITSFNQAAALITGVERSEALGRRCKDILRANVCETSCALRQTMQTGQPIINKPVHIVDAQGRRKSITISSALLKDQEGRIIGGVETFRDMTVVEELRKRLNKQYSCEDIISRSYEVQRLFEVLPRVAGSDCTVLIEGETGTGKELFALALHNLSPRAENPFVAVNCSALPDTLLESELFGHKAGAFTDAKADKPGRFALAEGGTMFLDEIGDISPAVQVKLLRVLQDRTYEPVGGIGTVKADIRVVTATNKDLSALTDSGAFRKDLFYRINIVRFELPPLRERKEDIPLLVDHFISRFNAFYGKEICCVSNDVMAVLLSHDYPGNIRELENIIEHCFVLCQGHLIESSDLPDSLQAHASEDARSLQGVRTLTQMEKLMIEQALQRHEGNRAAAARDLGINASTLFRKLKKLQIDM